MNKNIIFTALLIGFISFSEAMQNKHIKLPSSSILKERLNKLPLADYVEKTKIDEQLGNKEIMHPMAAVTIINSSLYDYYLLLHGRENQNEPLLTKRAEIIISVFENSQESISCLNKLGVFSEYISDYTSLMQVLHTDMAKVPNNVMFNELIQMTEKK